MLTWTNQITSKRPNNQTSTPCITRGKKIKSSNARRNAVRTGRRTSSRSAFEDVAYYYTTWTSNTIYKVKENKTGNTHYSTHTYFWKTWRYYNKTVEPYASTASSVSPPTCALPDVLPATFTRLEQTWKLSTNCLRFPKTWLPLYYTFDKQNISTTPPLHLLSQTSHPPTIPCCQSFQLQVNLEAYQHTTV